MAAVSVLAELTGISRSFGALEVISDLSLQVGEGEALGVVGPNGAGKTTMLNLLAGQLTPDRGQITYAGEDITHLPARRRCQLGIARTYQVPQPFGGLTVFENVLVGAAFGRDGGDSVRRAAAALEATGLRGLANRRAGTITLLERKRLELARALGARPRLLLLDEIAGGLTDPETRELVAGIADLRRAGISIVWIEHIVHALLAVVDRLVVLASGRVLTVGEPRAVIASPEVRDTFLGAEVG
jgi:branched-chain amino acid transport system ATP-binding protein